MLKCPQKINKKAIMLEYLGETKSIHQWSLDERCAVGHDTLRRRLKSGWDFDKSLLTPPEPNAKNIIGQKFGRLLVVESLGAFGKKGYQKQFVKCLCECGNTKILNLCTLGNHIFSCGCLKKENRFKKSGGYTKTNEKCLFYRYKSKAIERNIEWALSYEEFVSFLYKNCFYCDTIPLQGRDIKYNGIDRLDSSKGYIIDNCVTCCGRCNWSKGIMSYDQFIDMVYKIYQIHIINKK